MQEDIDLLKAGTKIVLTRRENKKGKFFSSEVGSIKSGTLSCDCQLNSTLFLKEGCIVGIVILVFKEDGDLRIETETHIDSVRIVTDDDDEEFRKFLLR